MSDINKEGFLSEEISNFEKNNLSKYQSLFSFYREVNSLSQEYAFKLSIPKSSVRKLVLSVLYLRSLSTFQSIYIFLSKGILNEAKVLLRTQLEIVFQFVAIVKNENYELNYLGQELIQRRKLLNKSKEWSKLIKDKLKPGELSKMLDEVQSEIKNKKIKEVSTKQFAEKAELMDFYHTAYAMLCLTSHANVMDLGNHFIFDEDGIVKSFNWGPSDNQLPSLIATALENQMVILINIDKEFKTEYKKEIDNLNNRFKYLFNKKIKTYT